MSFFERKEVKDLIAYAKQNPGKVRYTSAGVGSFPHYDMEVFARRAGVTMNHIPNKTGAAGRIAIEAVKLLEDQKTKGAA